MKKREIVTFMRGFMECYNTMIDLIEDETEPKAITYVSETSQDLAEPSQGIVNEEPEVEPSGNNSKPKPRTGTNVPEPKNVPHAPEKPTKTPMPDVKPTHDKFVEMFKEGKLPSEVGKALGVSTQTAYNHLTKAKDKGEL